MANVNSPSQGSLDETEIEGDIRSYALYHMVPTLWRRRHTRTVPTNLPSTAQPSPWRHCHFAERFSSYKNWPVRRALYGVVDRKTISQDNAQRQWKRGVWNAKS
jgi:hypothetical protein